MAQLNRPIRFPVNFTEAESTALREYANRHDMSQARVLRCALREFLAAKARGGGIK